MVTIGASGAAVAVGGLVGGMRVGGGGVSTAAKSVVGGRVVAVGGGDVGNSATGTEVGSGGAGWLHAVREKTKPNRIVDKPFIDTTYIGVNLSADLAGFDAEHQRWADRIGNLRGLKLTLMIPPIIARLTMK